MMRWRPLGAFVFVLALIGGLLAWAPGQTAAQTNLLVNGGLERPYYGQGAPTRTAPNGWSLWVGGGAPEAFPHTDRIQVLDGEVSWNVKQGYTAFTAAGYQRVSGLQPGTRLRASASAWVYTCNDTSTSCIIPDPPYRRSDPAAGASVKVGIDPTGGTDPLSPNVVWSGSAAPYDQWAQLSVVAEARGDAVTVFLYMTQAQGLALNNVYWDGAQLVRTDEAPTSGTGGEGAPPPVVQEVPFVVPQGVRPDGSIVHIIQQGDTLFSIAYAYAQYGVTRESIAALNEGITPRTALLVPGRQLMILPPGSVDPVTGRLLSDSERGSVTPVRTRTAPGGQVATPVPTITPRTPGTGIRRPVTSTPRPTALSTSPALPAASATPTASPAVQAAAASSTPTATPTMTATLRPTATASPTAPAVAAAPDLTAETGALCVRVFEDTNENGRRDAGESGLPGAEIVVTRGGEPSRTFAMAAGDDPLCTDLPAGAYEVSAALPDGYGPTTPDRVMVTLLKGGQVVWDFGALEGRAPRTAADLAPIDESVEVIEPGAVAPQVSLAPEDRQDVQTMFDRLWENSALIVLGLAGVVGLGSALLLALLRLFTR